MVRGEEQFCPEGLFRVRMDGHRFDLRLNIETFSIFARFASWAGSGSGATDPGPNLKNLKIQVYGGRVRFAQRENLQNLKSDLKKEIKGGQNNVKLEM